MEVRGERAVIKEESEGKGAAVLSPLSAWPRPAAGINAESKRTEIACRSQR